MAATMAAEKTTLYCSEGGSNKQYTVLMEPSGAGWLVNFQYGPVGGWVQSGTKTKSPVARPEAEKIRDSLLKQKRAKGYAEGADAPAFSQTDGDVDTGMRPMLLTWAEESDLERFIKDDGWGAQEKINGKRIQAKATQDGVIGANKRGLQCPIPKELQEALKDQTCVLDGELVGTTYRVFDLLEEFGTDLRKTEMTFRHQMAEKAVDGAGPNVRIVPLVYGEEQKRALVESLRAGRKEGVVFKKLNAPYEAGRRPSLEKAIAVKIKFYAEIAVEVLRWNKDKSSVEVAALDAGRLVSVGNVTVHDRYVSQIEVGMVIRVKYLYATDAAKLYQANLDPTDDGSVIADQVAADPISRLKFENKD